MLLLEPMSPTVNPRRLSTENPCPARSDRRQAILWALKGSSHPKSFVPVEVVPLPDLDIRISDTWLLLHKNAASSWKCHFQPNPWMRFMTLWHQTSGVYFLFSISTTNLNNVCRVIFFWNVRNHQCVFSCFGAAVELMPHILLFNADRRGVGTDTSIYKTQVL